MDNSRRDQPFSTRTTIARSSFSIAFVIAALKTSLSARTVLTPRMWALMAAFSASYLLLDAVAAFVISRLVYLGFRNGLEQRLVAQELHGRRNLRLLRGFRVRAGGAICAQVHRGTHTFALVAGG